jgi:hypothetical protein
VGKGVKTRGFSNQQLRVFFHLINIQPCDLLLDSPFG